MSYMNDDCDPFGIPYFSEHKSEKKVTKKDINSDKYWYDGCIIIGKGKELEVWESCNLLNQLSEENEQLKQSNNEAIELILDGIVEMHDGKRDYAEIIFNKAIRLLQGDVE